MKLFKNFLITKKFKRSVIAIGNFDGLHLGHNKVINQAKKLSKIKKTKFGILTFEPVPVMFFNPRIKNHRIFSLEQKIILLSKFADFIIVKKFDKKFSKLTHFDFVKKIIYKKINAKYIFVSKNFKYGFKRKGDIKTLEHLQKLYKYKTIITKPYKKKFKVISSTRVRKLLADGKIQEANKLLGKKWTVEGVVIRGKKRGRKLGFPTCNINFKDYIIPKFGVYAVNVKSAGINLRSGVANVGIRPTFKGKKVLLEVHIFNFSKNLYGKKINVEFKRFIRPEKKFKNFNELKKQIKLDIKESKK